MKRKNASATKKYTARTRNLERLLGALLTLAFAWTSVAAAFTDLPSTHWAYQEISRAVSYGIMNGLGDGRMNPDGALTWAHYLAMISRTFAPMAYEGARSSGVDWRTAGYQVCLNKGYLLSADFLTVTPESLNEPISREDVAVLLSRTLPAGQRSAPTPRTPVPNTDSGETTGGSSGGVTRDGDGGYRVNVGDDSNMQIVTTADGQIWLVVGGVSIPIANPERNAVYAPEDEPEASVPEPTGPVTADTALSDFGQMDNLRQTAVRWLYELGIVRGKSDGTFGPSDTVRRSDGAVLLMRTLDAVDELRDGEPVTLTLDIVDGDGKPIGESVTGEGRVNQRLYDLATVYAPANYKAAPQDGRVSVASGRYALRFAPLTRAELEERQAFEDYSQGRITYEELEAKDFWLRKLGSNSRKRALIFGVEGAEIAYATAEEAESHMTTVEVPVWRLEGGQKTPGRMSFKINAALADELLAIFTEIYNDPEQFPFADGGGYSWRESSPNSEHNHGTAVDVNVDANFQVRDGAALVGTHWTPGEDPYSVTPGGSVVRTFAEHGWAWGGNEWAGHSDASYGYHDYMHFSYLGT